MTTSPYSLFPITNYHLFPYGGAVQADGITSANTVGYSSQEVKAGQFYMVAVQLADVVGSGTSADFNTLLSTTCAPGVIGDGSDTTWGNAPMIQVLKENGQSYSYYYYVSDGDDGTYRFDLTGWVGEDGNILTGTQVPVGQSFWIKSATAGTFTFAL